MPPPLAPVLEHLVEWLTGVYQTVIEEGTPVEVTLLITPTVIRTNVTGRKGI